MVPYWQYLHWVVYVSAAIGTWRYLPLTLVRLVAAFTHDDQRRRQCLEVIRLSRKDAANIPSYLPTSEVSSTGQATATRTANVRTQSKRLAAIRRALGV